MTSTHHTSYNSITLDRSTSRGLMRYQSTNLHENSLNLRQHHSLHPNRALAANRSQLRTPRSTVPKRPGITLSPFTDSGVLGDNKTTFANVNLIGQTSANATVLLRGTNRSTTADDKGKFLFENVALQTGDNHFRVVAINAKQEKSAFRTTLKRVSVDRVSAVVEWNANALRAIVTGATPPPVAARNLAIVHTAMFDAVNSIVDRYQSYRVNLRTPKDASVEAAAVTAAYETLRKLYPLQQETFDAAYQKSIAQIPDGKSEIDGIAVGRLVATKILNSRKADGAAAVVNYTPVLKPGHWRPTAPVYLPAALPQWGRVTPFTMTSGSQFRPDAPPLLTSKQCAEELKQVKQLGRLHSRRRTAEQTEIALYWSDGGGTFTPPGHWNQIAGQIVADRGRSLLEDARTFALLNLGLADAGIAAWDAKYTYNSWRPIDAIRLADTDGNPLTKAAPGWNPLITTPNHPDYVSGHSTFSSTASQILSSIFGDRFTFSSGSIGLPGVTRTFNSFRDAANEAGISRIYGGIHTASANRAGQAIGRGLGDYIVANFLTPR